MSDKIIKIDDIEGKVYELDNWKPEQATQVKNHFTERLKELKKDEEKVDARYVTREEFRS